MVNCTEPVGIEPGGSTMAVIVTGVPNGTGDAGDDVRDIDVLSSPPAFTVRVVLESDPGSRFESPAKLYVIGYGTGDAGIADVSNDALNAPLLPVIVADCVKPSIEIVTDSPGAGNELPTPRTPLSEIGDDPAVIVCDGVSAVNSACGKATMTSEN